MNCTKSDIAYAASKLSRYISNSSDNHWNALLQLQEYQRECLEILEVSTRTWRV